MFYILLSICFSVTVSIILKVAKRYHIDVYQAITWNYSMAVLLALLFLKPSFHHMENAPYWIYIALGILLPVLFFVLAASVRVTGIVRTDVAQRLSLFIPVAASFIIFGESLSVVKTIGLLIGFAAIMLAIPWQRQIGGRHVQANTWIYLVSVFLGMGIIDVLFRQLALFKQVSSNTSLVIVFVLSFSVALIGLIYQVATKKMKFSFPHILIGWMLGLANFGNIFCYIKAHQALAKHPSVVFSLVNIGVILIGTLIGVFVFKEKLSTLNKIGILLAIIAIAIIYFPQNLANFFAKIF